MTEFLAAFGFIFLYFIWLISPIIMIFCISSDNASMTTLTGIVYIGGALVIAVCLLKFIGIW